MKLQTKINYRFLGLLLVIFLVAGLSLYFVLNALINNSLDEILENKMDRVEKNLTKHPALLLINDYPDQTVFVRHGIQQSVPVSFRDTMQIDKSEREPIEFRKVIFGVKSGQEFYEVTIVQSKLESEDLKELILWFMVMLFGIIVLVLFFLNNWLSASIWSPFYRSIEHLKTYSIGKKNSMTLETSDVYEFNQLNKSLTEMMDKVETDFNNLKEFTENASHEIQTPVAVIKNKLESVLQDESLNDKQYQQVQSAYESITKLSKINEGLLLLAKIENRQFPDSVQVDLGKLVQERLEFLEELIDFRKLAVQLRLDQPFIVPMNAYLAEMLINNLLSNAIKHNVENGLINLTMYPDKLVISNSGKPLTVEPEKLFQRFTKHHAGNDSTGLGLAIAAQICVVSGLHLEYCYKADLHELIISRKA